MPPTWQHYNTHVAAAARNQPLGGVYRPGTSLIRTKWRITTGRLLSAIGLGVTLNPTQPLYQVFIGDGTVNDRPATIEYLAKNDPRGWVMPKNYPPYTVLTGIYGPNYPFVDRPLWDTPQPFVLLTAPDVAEKNLGGFVLVPPELRPPFFRTAVMWGYNLYCAYVVVTISPFAADPSSALIATGGANATRWRVQAGLNPITVADAGVAQIASQELGRIYLTRMPGQLGLDVAYVQQTCCWPLRARSSLNAALLTLSGSTTNAAAGADIGLLALGGSISGALLGSDLESIIASTSTVLFWNA